MDPYSRILEQIHIVVIRKAWEMYAKEHPNVLKNIQYPKIPREVFDEVWDRVTQR